MRNSSFWWIIITIMVLVDIYAFFAIRSLLHDSSPKARTIFTVGYWSVSIFALVVLLLLPYFQFQPQNNIIRSTIFAIVFALFFAKLLATLFFLVDDARRGVQWMAGKLFSINNEVSEVSGSDGQGISRSHFLTWLGIAAGGGIFSTFVFGLSNKYNYQVKRIKIAFENLPAAFKGLKIVHISDIHSGSFTNKPAVNKGIDKILNEKPDVILFTGDLVNNQSNEMNNYIDIFSRLKAPMGVYSTLGNHDYGDYFTWKTIDEKRANLERIKAIHKELGWRLMLDEHLPLQKFEISKNSRRT